MSWSKLWYILTIFSIAGLIMVTGYLIGNRTWEIQKPDIISIKGANNAQINNLSSIKFKNLKAHINATTLSNVGDLMYQEVEGKTEILIRLNSLPITFGTGVDAIGYPKEYEILLAKRTLDGLNYETENIGIIALNEPQNNQYSGNFSTTLNYTLSQFETKFEKIVLVNNAVTQLPNFDNSNFPSDYRRQTSPFIWTE